MHPSLRSNIRDIITDPSHESAAAVDATVGKLLDRADATKDVVEIGRTPEQRLEAISTQWTIRTTDEWLVGGGRKKLVNVTIHKDGRTFNLDGLDLVKLVDLAERWAANLREVL